MPTYRIDSKASVLVVSARSSVHDTDTRWHGIEGTIDAAVDDMGATQATITVDMRTADAGDWLKNRKIRKDMNFEKYPEASFVVGSVSILQEQDAKVEATICGTLSWRGKSVAIEAKGSGSLTDNELTATGQFDLDVTTLGVKPPKILMFKIEDVVSCKVELRARV